MQVDRTERIKNCLNPRFSKKFVIDYYFEVVQKLKFGVYDIDNRTVELSDDDFLGEYECTLGQVSLRPCAVLGLGLARNRASKNLFNFSRQLTVSASLYGLRACCLGVRQSHFAKQSSCLLTHQPLHRMAFLALHVPSPESGLFRRAP